MKTQNTLPSSGQVPADRKLEWRKSSMSAAGDCVEVAPLHDALSGPTGGVALRDSKLGDESPILTFTPSEFDAFLGGVRAGEFDDLSANHRKKHTS